jgi:PAS domain S-box-containing protein
MLEAAILNSPSGILVADAPDVRITLANPAAFGIRGGDKKNLTGIELEKHSSQWQTYLPDGTLCPPEKLPLSRAILNGETVKDEEVIIRNEKGEDRWVSANASPILDDENKVKSGIVVFHDITVRKKAEEDLRYRNRLDKVAAKVSGMFVSRQGADYNTILKMMGENVSVNRAYIFKLKENGKKMDNTHEWCSCGTEPQIENLQDLDTDIFPWWMDRLRKGKAIIIEDLEELPGEAASEKLALESQNIKSALVFPVISKSGNLWGFMGFDDTRNYRKWKPMEIDILRVISDLLTSDLERTWTLEAYRESRERYKNLIDNLSDAVMEISFDTSILYCSPQTEEIFGYKPEEVVGRSYVDFIYEEDIEKCMVLLEQMIEKRFVSNFVYRTLHKNGEIKHISASAKIVEGKDGVLTMIGVLRDVTELMKSRLQVETEKNRAEFYLDLLSHDIGNIHQGLQAWTAIARSRKDDENEREYAFQKMMELEKRSIKLVRNVLLLSRLKDMREDLSRIDLIPILERSISEIKTLFAGREMVISLNADHEKVEVMAEPVFEEVFFNLLHNGVKFQYGDTVKMEIDLDIVGDDVRLDICDHGIGIPDDQKDRVFNRFVKGSDYGYSGIGLSLVRELVKRYDGTIEVLDRIENDPESGARFRITFPRAG